MQTEFFVDKKLELQRMERGEVVTFFRVWATSKGGVYFHVDLSEVDLDTARAHEILAKRAKELDVI